VTLSNNPGDDKRRRSYDSSRRAAAAARTREAVVRAAKELFEERGWAGTTVRAIAEAAGVSAKTVEAAFGTKAALLQTAVDFAVRGDLEPVPMPERDVVRRMERAPDAPALLELHATHLRRINERSAWIARAVEQAAPHDPAVGELWRRMKHNRAYAVSWAATTLLAKPGRRKGLRRRDVEATFWVALDWGTYRTLTEEAGLTPAECEAWLRRFYRATLLP
jgi:AcrR family transcriptional regulator